ncbi:RNA polymerase sigma factor [Amycolatopsis cihanbeyliensis]|uniref:RNA polymerase sigma factor (Sigma-70 family) n=1 Tax=Amycolatopsis cihanbeyliensis TaxID=1128664 RepID=A0A542DD01_AMYCI|nr:sigma-70 family RNA polymerase sigma factor [Amycolatopsis cihanbeyliensis]TQJ00949.1 RNA polymerase sigma factor (sigma-70 family) [Amycolatopsis cihanbeyliensis]
MTSPAEPTDAHLVELVLGGDHAAFAAIYDRYADRLHDFCVSILRNREDAADAVQDTFLLAAERLSQLGDARRLRPWLYAVARNAALRRARDRSRYAPEADMADNPDTGPVPQQAAEQAAVRDLVWSAAAGLSDRDRTLLDLHLRHGLDGAELAEAVGVGAGHAYVLLNRLRGQLERSLGALLIARLGRRDCTGLAALLRDWDGRFSPLVRKRVARHVDGCETCGERKRRTLSPVALLAAVPLVPAPTLLRDRVLGQVEPVAQVRDPRSDEPPPPRSGRRRVLAAGAALVVLTGTGVWLGTRDATTPELAGEATPGAAGTSGPASPAAAPPPTPSDSVAPAGPSGTTTLTRSATAPTSDAGRPDTTGPAFLHQSVHPPRVGVRGCPNDRADVRAEVDDDSGVEKVRLDWTDPDGRSGGAELLATEGSWRGTLGPFPRRGRVRWQLTATDQAGNTGTGTPGSLTVFACAPGTSTPNRVN